MNEIPSFLIELHYLPSVAIFEKWQQSGAKIWLLEAQEHYQKGTYRNRCHIATSHGILALSVPLKSGKNSQMPIQNVEIANETAWQRHHWQCIRSAYGSSPFWEHYSPYFEPLYQKKYETLWQWNMDLFLVVFRLLKWDTQPIALTSDYQKEGINDKTIDWRGQVTPKSKVIVRPYPQVFGYLKQDFLNNLSILDRLFCIGRFE